MHAFVNSIPVFGGNSNFKSGSVATFSTRTSSLPCLVSQSHQRKCIISMVAKPENEPDVKISSTVEKLYDTYPFPPETLLDEAPLGYNWRWHYPSVHSFCTGMAPVAHEDRKEPLKILDAGCGTGESTSFLVHQNPEAEITAMDLSSGALKVAKERLQRSLPDEQHRCKFHHLSIFDVNDLDPEIQYDYINCVGVIHHTPDPLRALKSLASKLKPGGFIHIFVYGINGRWEISLMQKALNILLKNNDGHNTNDFKKGVDLGRRLFENLPDGNRLKERERTRWAQENLKDATFADMYLHPQEIDYDIDSLFQLIDESGLQFVDFSNPRTWDISRLLNNDSQLLNLVNGVQNQKDRYKLVELLDPESITHFEFFLSKPPSSTKNTWHDKNELLKANAVMSKCIFGWPSNVIMDRDYFPLQLSDSDVTFLKSISENDQGNIIENAVSRSDISLDQVRKLSEQGIILLSPNS